MTDPRPLAERVREIALNFELGRDDAERAKMVERACLFHADARTLHEAADELEKMK
jgi:hypothetical protein